MSEIFEYVIIDLREMTKVKSQQKYNQHFCCSRVSFDFHEQMRFKHLAIFQIWPLKCLYWKKARLVTYKTLYQIASLVPPVVWNWRAMKLKTDAGINESFNQITAGIINLEIVLISFVRLSTV